MTTGQPQEKKPALTSGWQENLVNFARQINYNPSAPQGTDWRQPMPMADEDMAWLGAPKETTGIPENWDYRTAQLNPKGEPLPKGAVGWTPHGEPYYGGNSSLSNWYNGLNARLWQTDEDGKAPGKGQLAWRTLTEIVKGFVETINVATEEREKVQSGLEAAGEAVGLGETPWAKWNADNIKKAIDQYGGWQAKVGPSSAALFKALDMPSLAWDVVRGTIGLLSGKTEEFSEGYQSGRIAYSAVIDDQVRAEYLRRLDAGENPYLLAEELKNPSAELFGELAGDPTMFLGWLGKTNRVLGFTGKASEYAAKPIEAVRTILGSKAVAESDTLGKIAAIADEGAKAIQQIGQAFDAKAANTAFGAGWASGVLTKDSQRLFVSNIVSSFTSIMAGTVRQMRGAAPWIDDVGEGIRAFWLMGSGKVDDFKVGAQIASRYLPTNVAFSQQAMEYATLLRKMLPDERAADRLLKSISEAQNVGEVATKIGDRMLNFSKEFIPTMSQRLSALDKAATGATLTAREQVLVNMGDIGSAGRAIARFEGIANSAPVKGLNQFFGIMYMGVSPGFAARNLLNNMFTAFIDEGVEAAVRVGRANVRKAGAIAEEAELAAIFGGAVPKELAQEFGLSKSAVDIAEGGGFLKRAATWLGTIGTRLGANAERNTSIILSHKGVVDTMNKATTAMMREMGGELAARGFDAGMVDRLLRINNFDVYKVRDILADAAKNGTIDLFQSRAWMSAADEAGLRSYKLYSRLMDALGAIDPNDLSAKRGVIKEILAFAEQRAAKAVAEAPISDGQLADIVDNIAPDALNAVRKHQQNANEFAEMAYEGLVRRINTQAERIGLGDAVRAIFDGNPQYTALLNESNGWQEAVTAARDAVWGDRIALYKQFFPSGKKATLGTAVDWAEVGTRLGLREMVSGKDELIARFWDEYFSWASKHYQTGRDEYVGLARQFYDEVSKLSPELGEQFGGELAKARQALRDAMEWDGAKALDDVFVNAAGKPITHTAYLGLGDTPTMPRAFAEGMDGTRDLLLRLDEALVRTHGTRPRIDPKLAQNLDWLTKTVGDRMTEARAVGAKVGKQMRDFAILDYTRKDNLDTAFSLIYPYQYWYRGTYKNWLKRIAADPYLISAYASYKDYMAEIHAGLPDWWKYNLNSNELLGIQSENPLFFNLEQTLNPLNGLTGVDFNDSYKKVDWWTRTLDGMNKFGPSTWTPLSIVTALALYMRGEKDAASRWAGRLLPASATIEAAGNVLGAKPFNADPFVAFFSDGIDPYTERRVNRALSAMVQEGVITEDMAVDAASTHSGDAWEQARSRAVGERSWGQLASYFLGTGFKARTISDIQIDNFYEDYNHFWNIKPNMSQEEFRNGMEQMRQAYPFMDTLLLGNKQDNKRDGALAYLVLNRLPPGGAGMTEAVGIDERLLDKFYETKGDFSTWQQTERDRFMAGIVDLRAILATPADSVRAEWNQARNLYSEMRSAVEQQLGAGIWDEVDGYYAQRATNPNLQPSERVAAALDLKSQLVASNATLATYYGGIETIGKYYQSLMWNDVEQRFGADFWTRLDAGEVSAAERKKYYKLLDAWNERIDAQVLKLGRYLPERQGAQIRQDIGETTPYQEDFIQSLQPPMVSEADVVNEIGETAYEIVLDFLNGGPPLPYSVRNKLQAYAEGVGIDYYVLLQLLQQQPILQ